MSVASGTADRHVVIHYHIFKNAGTSIDRALRTHFGSTWATFEAGDTKRDPSGHLSPGQIQRFLDENRVVQALSSHTADLPAPSIEGLVVHPIIMLRHPLDRIRSIYDFARNQKEDTPNSRLARAMSRAEFIARGLDLAPGQGRRVYASYQAAVLARGASEGSEAQRVEATLKRLPFVGVVEEYDRSMSLLVEQLKPFFPGITLGSHQLNSSRREDSLDMRLAELQQELGDALYARLVVANELDVTLWAAASNQVQAAAGPAT